MASVGGEKIDGSGGSLDPMVYGDPVRTPNLTRSVYEHEAQQEEDQALLILVWVGCGR